MHDSVTTLSLSVLGVNIPVGVLDAGDDQRRGLDPARALNSGDSLRRPAFEQVLCLRSNHVHQIRI